MMITRREMFIVWIRSHTILRGSITYNTAKFITDIIKPLVGKTPRHLQNSQDLLNKLKDVRVGDSEEMVSYDVTALFMSVPVNDSLTIIRRKLENDSELSNHTSLSVDHVIELLKCCLTTTYFLFDGEFYTQTEGAAMGSPVSPLVANLFMEDFEERALSSYPHPPRFWGRYVDDTFVIIEKEHIIPFTNHINSLHPAIHFTTENESEGQLPMLDVMVKKKDSGLLSFSVYRKATHTDHYLQFDSHQPLEHKLGVMRTLRHRTNTTVTDQQVRREEEDHIKKALSIAGYPKWTWNMPGTSKKGSQNKEKRQIKGHITLPYIKGVTEHLTRIIRSHDVAVHTRPMNKMRDILVAPKDPTSHLDRSGVVYKVKCNDCTSAYVGETARPLRSRISEHHRDSSPVGFHARQELHRVEFDEVQILDREPGWFRRGVKEAIHIEVEGSDLNRDRDCYTLPPQSTGTFFTHSKLWFPATNLWVTSPTCAVATTG